MSARVFIFAALQGVECQEFHTHARKRILLTEKQLFEAKPKTMDLETRRAKAHEYYVADREKLEPGGQENSGGETEMMYLEDLTEDELEAAYERMMWAQDCEPAEDDDGDGWSPEEDI